MLGSLLRDISRKVGGRRGYLAAAESAYKRAVSGLEKGQLHEAELAYREAIELDVDSAPLHYNLGLLLHQLGLHEQAVTCLKQATALCPDLHAAHASLFSALEMAGVLPRRQLYDLHLEWSRKHADHLSAMRTDSPMSLKPKRIGYVSGDFRRHVVGRFIEPIIRCHDRSRFQVTCYSSNALRDDMTEHLEGMADTWHQVSTLDDNQLAELIRRDRIDILVDLSGHSAGNRLLTFARKAAPVQVTWMGYLNTTGMAAMNYRISDPISDPQGTEGFYREALLRLPHPQWCYVPEAGPVTSPEIVHSVLSKDDPVRLACITRFMKITDSMICLWVDILKAVPAARLTIIDVPRHPRADWLLDQFQDAELENKVRLLPTLDSGDYWNLLAHTDLALDTFPYTGATTTLDCLWAEVPVVTLRGECGAARSASSILHAVGLQDLIADSPEGYVRKVVELAGCRQRLIQIGRGLRQRMLESPMCNAERFTRNLETVLESAWDANRMAVSSNDV